MRRSTAGIITLVAAASLWLSLCVGSFFVQVELGAPIDHPRYDYQVFRTRAFEFGFIRFTRLSDEDARRQTIATVPAEGYRRFEWGPVPFDSPTDRLFGAGYGWRITYPWALSLAVVALIMWLIGIPWLSVRWFRRRGTQAE